MHGLIRGLLDLFWPIDCLACGEPVDAPGFCPGCDALTEPRGGPRCRQCDGALPTEGPAHRCGRCLRRPPAFDRAWGLFDYAGPLGDAIRAGKYAKRPDAFPVVCRRLLLDLPAELIADPPTLVMPIPLHWRRLEQRGFHPPLVLARTVAAGLDRPCQWRTIRRTRDTPTQAGLDEAERRRNVRGAFSTQGRLPLDVLLVDDVMTTGATAQEVARAAKRSGARRVRVLTAAYVERDAAAVDAPSSASTVVA